MRIKSGIVCALSMSLAFVLGCADSGTGDDGAGDDQMGDQNQNVCGDGTCAASEVGFCAMDCGNGGNGNGSGGAVCGNTQCETTKGESVSTCPSDCNTPGNGSGSNNGSTNCPSDQTVCFLCLLDATFCMGVDQQTCQSCLGGGLGSGSGFPMP